jgi:hypothetical protein
MDIAICKIPSRRFEGILVRHLQQKQDDLPIQTYSPPKSTNFLELNSLL